MTRKKKRQKQRRPAPTQDINTPDTSSVDTTPSAAAPPPEIKTLRRRLWEIARDLMWSIVLFVVLIFAKEHWIDHSIVGERLRQTTYDISQLWLSASRDPGDTAVVVVDIGSLDKCPRLLPDGKTLSPRDALQDAVTTVMNHDPAAVAIDVDFSPGVLSPCPKISPAGGPRVNAPDEETLLWPERGGPPFFEFCLQQSTPIFLGVYRTQFDSPPEWLGAERYSKLAATIVLPYDETEDHAAGPHQDGIHRYMTRQLVREGQGELDSIAYALSKHKRIPKSWTQTRLENLRGMTLPLVVSDHLEDGVNLDKFLVDFSGLKQLEKTTAEYLDKKLVLRDAALKDKLVVLGYTATAEAPDKFIVPGDVRQVAGVYWHAAAADTLLRGVLGRPSPTGEKVLDALFYLPIIFLIAILRLIYARKPDVRIATHRIESVGTKIAAVCVFLVGTYFVSTTRLMWDGFLLVAVFTALHPTIERYLNGAVGWFWRSIKQALPRFFFEH